MDSAQNVSIYKRKYFYLLLAICLTLLAFLGINGLDAFIVSALRSLKSTREDTECENDKKLRLSPTRIFCEPGDSRKIPIDLAGHEISDLFLVLCKEKKLDERFNTAILLSRKNPEFIVTWKKEQLQKVNLFFFHCINDVARCTNFTRAVWKIDRRNDRCYYLVSYDAFRICYNVYYVFISARIGGRTISNRELENIVRIIEYWFK